MNPEAGNKKHGPSAADDLLRVLEIETTEAKIANQQKKAVELFRNGTISLATYEQEISESSGQVEPMEREASKQAALDRINGTRPSVAKRLARFVFHRT